MARIMVVDDNPTNLRLAADLLEFEGYDGRHGPSTPNTLRC